MNWLESLEDLFSATVNQQTLEEAVDLMLSVSLNDEEYHNECLNTLNEAIKACETNSSEIIDKINTSGYQVQNIKQAKTLLTDFLDIYKKEYELNH